MRPNQLWLDFSHSQRLRVWVNEKLELASAKSVPAQRLGFFKEIPLYHLNPESARTLGWTSFAWEDVVGKFPLDKSFWPQLEAARLTLFEERPEKFLAPLMHELPLASDVAFYGGTFAPWHQGHGACVDLSPREMPLFVCPDRNPHKPLKTEADVVDHICSLSLQIHRSVSRPVHVYPGFLLKGTHNPTVNWVLRLKQHRPDLRIHLLLGYDSFANLKTWTRASDLVALLSGVLVASRKELDQDHATDSAWPLSVNPKLSIKFLGHHAFEHLASSEPHRA